MLIGLLITRGVGVFEAPINDRSVTSESGKEIRVPLAPKGLAGSRPENDRRLEPNVAINKREKATSPDAAVLKERRSRASANPIADAADVVPPRPAPKSTSSRQTSFLGDEPPLPSAAHDPRALESDRGRPMLVAPYCANSPVVDGVVQEAEYGQARYVDFTFTANSRFGALVPRMPDPKTSKTPDDLSVRIRAVYTDRSLFLAFQVRDQFVDDEESDRGRPQCNDGLEIFLDGDRVSNDYSWPIGHAAIGSPEGFQLIANAAGHQLTTAPASGTRTGKPRPGNTRKDM